MVRVRVKARNFYRLESSGRLSHKRGRPGLRYPVHYPAGSELVVTRAFYEKHKDAFTLLGTVAEGEARAAPETVDDLDALRAEAAELGIEVNKRWRAGRLNDEIAKARAELEDEDPDKDPDEDPEDGDDAAD